MLLLQPDNFFKYTFMKSFFLIFLLFCSFHVTFADSSDSNSGRESHKKSGAIVVDDAPSLRAPARCDLLLVIEETGITIRFNGDFGPGFYQISDNESGFSVSGSIVAEAGSTEYVPFPVTTTTSFDFDIEFEDGSWSHLTWGE